MKRIVICADGTWNSPEEEIGKDFPTNVLKFSRAIVPETDEGVVQTVYYDWGIGSYHDSLAGGGFGKGLDKNIKDCYRYIVHNYEPGDELFFFGFSRGAYTVRSLCGFINNCSILKREHANRINEAYDLYKDSSIKPSDDYSVNYRADYSISDRTTIKFIGVWDTVGALGLPFSIFAFINEKHLFHDQKIGSIIETARHALSIDESRDDFKPTIWEPNEAVDLKQTWFAGVHSDVGGSYPPDSNGDCLSDIPMVWMKKQASKKGLAFEAYLEDVELNALSEQHEEYKKHYLLLGKHNREILPHTFIHKSVKQRFTQMESYNPKELVKYVDKYGWNNIDED